MAPVCGVESFPKPSLNDVLFPYVEKTKDQDGTFFKRLTNLKTSLSLNRSIFTIGLAYPTLHCNTQALGSIGTPGKPEAFPQLVL